MTMTIAQLAEADQTAAAIRELASFVLGAHKLSGAERLMYVWNIEGVELLIAYDPEDEPDEVTAIVRGSGERVWKLPVEALGMRRMDEPGFEDGQEAVACALAELGGRELVIE